MRGLLQRRRPAAYLAAPILALLVALALSSAGYARRGAAPAAADNPTVSVTASTAEVTAFAYDNLSPNAHTETIPGSNFETFNNTATASDLDNSNDRGGTSEVTQNTAIKSPSDLAKITSTGDEKTNWLADERTADPIATASNKLSVSFTVAGGPRPFKLKGTLTATSASTVQCTTVKVTSPTGDTLHGVRPGSLRAGAPGSATIDQHHVLQPGSYTFSVEALALANMPNAPEGAHGFADTTSTSPSRSATTTSPPATTRSPGPPGTTSSAAATATTRSTAWGVTTPSTRARVTTHVDGGPGNDTIYGGPGDDGDLLSGDCTFTGGADDDTVFGGSRR